MSWCTLFYVTWGLRYTPSISKACLILMILKCNWGGGVVYMVYGIVSLFPLCVSKVGGSCFHICHRIFLDGIYSF